MQLYCAHSEPHVSVIILTRWSVWYAFVSCMAKLLLELMTNTVQRLWPFLLTRFIKSFKECETRQVWRIHLHLSVSQSCRCRRKQELTPVTGTGATSKLAPVHVCLSVPVSLSACLSVSRHPAVAHRLISVFNADTSSHKSSHPVEELEIGILV